MMLILILFYGSHNLVVSTSPVCMVKEDIIQNHSHKDMLECCVYVWDIVEVSTGPLDPTVE